MALRSYPPGAIALGRLLFGLATIEAVPATRKPVTRSGWPWIAVLGTIWFGIPMILFPIAQQSVASSIAGMLTGSMLIFAVFVGMVWHHQMPQRPTLIGVLVGFGGILMISSPKVVGEEAAPWGISLILFAVLLYAISVHIAAPLQQRNGALPVVMRVLAVSSVVVFPLSLFGFADSDPEPLPSPALVALGLLATAWPPVALTTLVGRTGAEHGPVSVYFIPVVAAVLGWTFLART